MLCNIFNSISIKTINHFTVKYKKPDKNNLNTLLCIMYSVCIMNYVLCIQSKLKFLRIEFLVNNYTFSTIQNFYFFSI